MASDYGDPVERYRPANGTEGRWFMDKFCKRCRHDDPDDPARHCPLIARAMCFDVDDPNYPEEWCYDATGHPTCTGFEEKEAHDGK